MALKFDFKSFGESAEYDWPVRVKEPKNGGGFQDAEFTARFKLISIAELQKMDLRSKEAGENPHLVLETVLVGLGKDEGELTPELKAKLISMEFTRSALIRAFGELLNGAPVKN